MSQDFTPVEPKAPRVSIYDRNNPRDALWRSQHRPLDRSTLLPKAKRARRGRDKSRELFPFAHEGRKEQSARVNVGAYDFPHALIGAICDTRLTSGDRVFDTVRYMRGRHPSESVEHYEARRGR
jgi:hypothetical protein